MEISFKRVNNPYSSKPPITLRTKGHEVYVTSSGPISSEESQGIVRSFFRENAPKEHNNKKQIALNTSKNDVFILRGESAQSAELTKQSYDELNHSADKEHNLTQILLQPKKAKRQAAIYFDATSMQGKKLSVVNVDKSEKGRVKIRVKALDVMA